MVKRILTILLLLVSVAAYSQTTWYIDPDGSDVSGNGSITKPWASLSHATDTVTFSGDVIHVNTGTYNETAQCILAVGVSIIGEGVSSIINTTFVNASALQAAIQCASTGGIANDNSSISHFTLSGTNKTASRAIYVGYRSNVIIEHMTIIGFNAGGIYLDAGSTDSNPFATGNVIRYCTITDASHQPNDYNGSIRVRGQTNWQITNNVIDNTITAGGGNGNTIAAVRNKKGIISDNTFSRNDTELSYWNFFSEINDSRGDLQYLRNTHYGLAKSSFGGINRIDEDCTYGVDFMYNRYLNPAVGNRTNSGTTETKYCLNLEGEGHINLRVMYNYIQHYGWGIELSTPTSEDGTYWEYNWVFDSITIAYNILDGIGYADYAYSHGIRWLNESNLDGYAGTFSKILIANNTIIAHDGEYDGYTGMEIDANGTVTGFKVASNIISGFASNAINFKEHGSDFLSVSETGFYNNCLFDSGTDEVVVEEGITGTVTVTGNITTDPLFVSSSDFSLQPSSPAINAGIDVGLTSDYIGTTVPQGGVPDIGAYEYYSLPIATTGLGWEDHLAKRNFKDDVNFAGRWMIDAIPVTATAAELNALVGQGQIISGLDTLSLSTRIDAKADTSLSNLSSVAINTHLLPDTAGTINLGSGAKPFAKIFGGSTIVSDLSIGDSTSNTIAKFDSVAVFNGKLYAFVNGDTVGWGVLTADSEDITDHVIMLTDTIHTNGKHILYTQWQVDSIFAGFTSGFDSVYIYAKVDSLINVVGEQQSQIDLLWAAIDSLGLGDFNPPTFLSAEVGGFHDSILVIILNETDIQQDSIPAVGAFTIKENGSAMGIEAIDIGNDTVYISLDALAIEGYAYTVSYNKDFDYPQLQDSSENITPSWTDRTVTNNVFDAFPSIVSVTETLTNSTDRTSHPITMPAEVDEGDLLLVFFASDAISGLTYTIDTDLSDAGWTLESYATVNTAGSVVLWKVADADGDTLTITTSQSQISAAQTYRITNFDPADPIQAVNFHGTPDQYPDPPAATGDYGADDYLWIVSYGADSGSSYATAAPADFTGLEITYVDSAGSCSLNSAYRKYNINGAYDPGTFTANTTDEEWVSNTVIVNPIQ